jgi:TPR repeat protein
MYYFGSGVAKDFEEAVKWYLKAAEQGESEAQYNLGVMYAIGQGVAKNEKRAVEWYLRAAEKNVAKAQYLLGWRYQEGRGVEKNPSRAFKYYQLAAAQNENRALRTLAWMYENGEGIPEGIENAKEEALKYFHRAAQAGNAYAQFDLGMKYKEGEGLQEDLVRARGLFLTAAQQGNRNAMDYLARMYLNGDGITANPQEAAKWFRGAAEKGDADSQFALGKMYAEGRGVPRDLVQAYIWWTLAEDNHLPEGKWIFKGDLLAKKEKEKLAGQMSGRQIGDALRLAREYAQKVYPDVLDTNPEGGGRSDTAGRIMETGTGFLITSNGYLLTNYHVVRSHHRAQFTGSQLRIRDNSGRELPATIVKVSEKSDLALLKVEGVHDPIPLNVDKQAGLGQDVFTIGYPNPGLQGYTQKLTKGLISGLAGVKDDPTHYQISVGVEPGNSGGPLVGDRGNVVGVIVSRLSERAALETSGVLPQNVNYAIQGPIVGSFLKTLPAVISKLEKPLTENEPRKFDVTVKDVQGAVVLVLVYGEL